MSKCGILLYVCNLCVLIAAQNMDRHYQLSPHYGNQGRQFAFWLRQELSKSLRVFIRLAQSALGHSIFLFFNLEQSGSVSGQSQVSFRSVSGLEALLTHFVVQSEPFLLFLISPGAFLKVKYIKYKIYVSKTSKNLYVKVKAKNLHKNPDFFF